MEHMLASKITQWCMRHNEMSETQAEVVTYGIELLFNNIFKFIGLLILGILFHRTGEVVLSIACFSLLRSQAGGLHLETNIGCFSSMMFICILSCAGAEFVHELPLALLVVVSVAIVVLNIVYAPFVTKNKPIEDKMILRRKHICAVVLAVLLLAVMWAVPAWNIKMLILVPVTIETLTILPCWHRKE